MTRPCLDPHEPGRALPTVTARDAELHALSIWPGLHTVAMGDWLNRAELAPVGRRAKRANSALAMGSADRPAAKAITVIEQFYACRGLPPLAQVEPGSAAAADFAAAGWRPLGIGDSFFQLAPLSGVRKSLRLISARDGAPVAQVEAGPDQPQALARLDDGGEVLAVGNAALHQGWLALHGVETASSMRRRGLARAVLAALLDWGAERGAEIVWLHVEANNPAAMALYGGLGFRTHHSCRYLTAPARAGPYCGDHADSGRDLRTGPRQDQPGVDRGADAT